MSRPLKVMLVAVEAAADSLGAGLMRALRARLGDTVTFVGVGGERMHGQCSTEELSSRSISNQRLVAL